MVCGNNRVLRCDRQLVGPERPICNMNVQRWNHSGFTQHLLESERKIMEQPITSVSLLWDIRYQEGGEPKFRIEADFFYKTLQELVKGVEVDSITFYGMGFTDSVDGIAHEKRIYEELLTKTEFMKITDAWIEERKKQIGIVNP